MSDRRLTQQRVAARDQVRRTEERLARLELQLRSLQLGLVPFSKIVLAGVEITVTDTGGGGKDVTFYNPASGLSSVINL